MSQTPPDVQGPAPPSPPPGTIRCARCGADVPPDADWCLNCGLAARTRIAPTPRWRVPVYVTAGICALALAAMAVAFVDLTSDGEPASSAATAPTTAATQPTTPPAVTPPGASAPTAPEATTPEALPPADVQTAPGQAAAPGGAEAPSATAPATPQTEPSVPPATEPVP